MKRILPVLTGIILAGIILAAAPTSSLNGKWIFDKDKSTNLAPWRYRVPQLDISISGDHATILRQWIDRKRIAFTDSASFVIGGAPTEIPVESPIWSGNWYMGVLSKEHSAQSVSGDWIESPVALKTVSRETVEVSQGEAQITTTSEYRLSSDGNILTITEHRSSRPTPVVLVFTRMETN